MFRRISLLGVLASLVVLSSPAFSDDVGTYVVKFSVTQDLDRAVTKVERLFSKNNVTISNIEYDFAENSALFFVVMGGESVRNDLDLLFKENRKSLPSDLSVRSITTDEEWQVTKLVNFVVEFTAKDDLENAIKQLTQLLQEADVTVWGSISLTAKGAAALFVKLPANLGSTKLKSVITSSIVLPTGFLLQSIEDYDTWLLGNN